MLFLPGETGMKTAGAVAPLSQIHSQHPPPHPFPLLIHSPPPVDVRRGLGRENELLYNEAQETHPEKGQFDEGFNEWRPSA